MSIKRDFLLYVARHILAVILPARCALTGEIVPESGQLSPAAWGQLHFITDPMCKCCGLPFEAVMEGGGDIICGPCVSETKPYRRARAARTYTDESRKLILAFKHGDQTHLTVTFAPMLKKAGGEFWDGCDMIVPVPLHWRRMVSRRYNQAALLAQAVSKVTGVPSAVSALRRTRHTPTQGHLSRKHRAKNVARAFAVHPKFESSMQGKNIVLVDDVFTTGATIEECVCALQAAGAARVDVLTIARVVRPESIS